MRFKKRGKLVKYVYKEYKIRLFSLGILRVSLFRLKRGKNVAKFTYRIELSKGWE